jgi:murein DD-endopeptidase MepM/ murein hydrolase activator NlpD
MKVTKFCSICCLVLSWTVCAVGGEEPASRFEKITQRMVEAFNAEDYLRMRQDYSKLMADAFPQEKSTPVFAGLKAQFGKIVKLEPPRLTPPNQAVFPAQFERGKLAIKIVLDEQDKMTGLWFAPYTPTIPVPDRHQTVLRLPFDGEWFVVWGGDTKELNAHHDAPNQRYAFDFVVVDNLGKTHKGEGKQNEDFFAFGKPVLAPADGVVTDVISGVRDNEPGSMNPYSALGNAVVIRHREHEVSVLAHFKLGSIAVKVGDAVKRGQSLGLCGNSGNSSEPHIHFHLQNTPIIQDGTGIRCRFDKPLVRRDGTTQSKADYSPVKGDIVGQR